MSGATLICPAESTLAAKRFAQSGVYFLQELPRETGCIKIGWSENVTSRIASLQTGNSKKLHLLFVLEGNASDERRLHRWFSEYRTIGEWFLCVGEVKDFVDAVLDRLRPAPIGCAMRGQWDVPCLGRLVTSHDGVYETVTCEAHVWNGPYNKIRIRAELFGQDLERSAWQTEDCAMKGHLNAPCLGRRVFKHDVGVVTCEAHAFGGPYERIFQMGEASGGMVKP